MLAQLAKSYPEWQVTALVLGVEDGQHVKACYPKVTVLIGSLDDTETLEKEAADVDVVLSM